MSVLIWHHQLPQQQLGDFWILQFHSGGQRLLKLQQLMTEGSQLCLQHWSHESKIVKTNRKFLRLRVKTFPKINPPLRIFWKCCPQSRTFFSCFVFLNLHSLGVYMNISELFLKKIRSNKTVSFTPSLQGEKGDDFSVLFYLFMQFSFSFNITKKWESLE